MYSEFGIKKELLEIAKEVEKDVEEQFKKVEEVKEINSLKVLNAFQKCGLSEMHLHSSTGYGIDEIGRNKIEEIYSKIFNTEDALVRAQLISGTHALAVTLFGILRPGDIMLSITGLPYDTLQTTIGISKENSKSSLKEFGVKYEQIDLKDGLFDIPAIKKRASKNDIKMIMVQRSRGYAFRKAFTIEELAEVFKAIREVNSDVIIMVDNCYGEFVDTKEPTHVGADIAVGSLIKNIGAGIAPTGGYIVGKKNLIELISDRYSAPGLGKEGGATFGLNRQVLQGLFMAPHTVAQAIKIDIFAARMLEKLGYETYPKYDEKRSDIVQMIKFNDENKLIKYCQAIQANSPIDSHVVPEPWDMPGYEDKVIMASGAFTAGSSIELSCDGPVRPPYIAYMQGGLTYASGKLAVIRAIENINK